MPKCPYPCGSKYASSKYAFAVERAVSEEVDRLSSFCSSVAKLCEPKNSSILQSNLLAQARYSPGVPTDVAEVFPEVYEGPSLDVCVILQISDEKTGMYLEKTYTYMVMFNGESGVVDDFSLYNCKVDASDPFQVEAELAANALFAQIPLFDFSIFNKAVSPFIVEFNESFSNVRK